MSIVAVVSRTWMHPTVSTMLPRQREKGTPFIEDQTSLELHSSWAILLHLFYSDKLWSVT